MCDKKYLDTICIMCPVGCQLKIKKNGEEIEVEGNSCPRGEVYGKQEIVLPKRVVTSTVQGEKNRFAVKTSNPIPKDKIFDIMQEISKISIKNAKIGDILIKNVLNYDSDIVVTGII